MKIDLNPSLPQGKLGHSLSGGCLNLKMENERR
jgi:hypothetical protein